MLTGLIIVISLMVVFSIVFLFWDKIKFAKEKRSFSKLIGKKAYQLALDNAYYLINQVALAIEGKVIHFDHILFTNKFIYCIGEKYFSGPISGRFDDSQWFKYNKKNQVEHIKNPMILPKVRVEYLRGSLRANDDLFVSVVLVNDSCIIDQIEGCPKNNFIMNLSDFKSFIKQREKTNIPSIDPLQLETLVQNIYKISVRTLKSENKKSS